MTNKRMIIRIGIEVKCQNDHKAIYWYRLEDLEWIDEGVKCAEKCPCPKLAFGQGYTRISNSLVTENECFPSEE